VIRTQDGSMRRCCFVAMPRNGQVDPESQKAGYATVSVELAYTTSDRNGSDLPGNFNQLMCECLNQGDQFDYWSMLHSDMAPFTTETRRWLDIHVDELEEQKLDVIHAVAAIKDDKAVTSTAVLNLEDQWAIGRRLTVKELYKLPDTFTLDDILNLIDGPWPKNPFLAPNTGCMTVKLGHAKMRKFMLDEAFQFRHRAGEHSDGRLYWQFVPEDWAFGRWCAKNRLTVAGTKKVLTAHFGRHMFTTLPGWGTWDRDEQYFKEINRVRDHDYGVAAE